MAFEKVAFLASRSEQAHAGLQEMTRRYGNVPADEADILVAIGGDGFMLQTMHGHIGLKKPIYGLMKGSVGFLMNQYEADLELPERLARAESAILHPLRMVARGDSGVEMAALAFNEVSLLRQTKQAAKVRIYINETVKVDELICDGILLSTPAGSTAYNLSAHGPIIPLGAKIFALTPISPFRPRRWRGALLPCDVGAKFEILDHHKRPVSATADAFEVRDVVEVKVAEATDVDLQIMFDPEHNLEDRILNEQFTI